MLPENMTNRPGDVHMKMYAVESMIKHIERIKKSLITKDINGKLPGEYEE